MSIQDNGGPAFPVAWPLPNAPEPGMSLRDYFAGKALQGELASQGIDFLITEARYDGLAERCYSIADAMLKARKT